MSIASRKVAKIKWVWAGTGSIFGGGGGSDLGCAFRFHEFDGIFLFRREGRR